MAAGLFRTQSLGRIGGRGAKRRQCRGKDREGQHEEGAYGIDHGLVAPIQKRNAPTRRDTANEPKMPKTHLARAISAPALSTSPRTFKDPKERTSGNAAG